MSDEYRKLRYVRFYKDRVNVGREGYNPAMTLYYNSSDELIKVRESWRDEVWEQTISGTTTGSGVMNQTIDYETYFDSWIKL
jgi:hypothetical protein